MADPFVAEIRMMGCNFAPRGYAFCNGQLLAISQNTALFSLVGTYYGGNGMSNFALPNLQGKSPMMWGQGPGLTDRFIGEEGGVESVALLQTEMPLHTHPVIGGSGRGTKTSPTGNTWAVAGTGRQQTSMYSATTDGTHLDANAITSAGSGLPHNNMPPYLAVNFVIALQGVFPSRG